MGHFTHQAYAFVRRHHGKRVFAIRGEPKPGGPIKGKAYPQDVNYRGKIIKNGVQLWYIGTQTAKDLVFGRLTKVTTPGPGYIHFPRGLPDDYYKGLTSEKRVLVKTARGYVTTWVKPTSTTRNEPWDTMIYCEHLVYMLDLHRYTKTQWARLEDSLTPDLFGAKAAALPAPVDAPQSPAAQATARAIARPARSRGRSNFVTSY
jgi:phage terminase large subunit GpA-like protein